MFISSTEGGGLIIKMDFHEKVKFKFLLEATRNKISRTHIPFINELESKILGSIFKKEG